MAGQYTEAAMFELLETELKRVSEAHGTEGNALFYLAMPPTIVTNLIDKRFGRAGLIGRRGSMVPRYY